MEIIAEKHCVKYDEKKRRIHFTGSLLLNGAKEYAPILNMLLHIASQCNNKKLTLDISKLKFLNSSGISMMAKFIVNIDGAKGGALNLVVIAQDSVYWQTKLAKNLCRLMPELKVKLLKSDE